MSIPISSKRDLISVLGGLLVPHGFVRVKDDWYLDNGECIAVIGLGKSFYGGQFSLGIDILLKESARIATFSTSVLVSFPRVWRRCSYAQPRLLKGCA